MYVVGVRRDVVSCAVARAEGNYDRRCHRLRQLVYHLPLRAQAAQSRNGDQFFNLAHCPFLLNLTLGMSCQMRVAIDRFSADAFYGGLAAAAASVFKSVLYAFLSSH